MFPGVEAIGAECVAYLNSRVRECSGVTGPVLLFLSLVILLGACTPNTPASTTPTAIRLEPGKGAIRGRLTTLPEAWQGQEIYAYAAPYLGPAEGEGIFVLDAALHPTGPVDQDGWFQIAPVDPGEYVLVFGPDPEAAIAFRQGLKAVRYRVEASETVDVGSLTLAP